jgi:hypothetical protein
MASLLLNLNVVFEACLLLGVIQTAENNYSYLQWITPTGKKSCLLAQVLVTFYGNQIHLEASFSFVSNRNLTGQTPTSSWNVQKSTCQVGTREHWQEMTPRITKYNKGINMRVRDTTIFEMKSHAREWLLSLYPGVFNLTKLFNKPDAKRERTILFSLFSMTRLGNTQKVVLSRCRHFINMTNGVKLSYYWGNTKT